MADIYREDIATIDLTEPLRREQVGKTFATGDKLGNRVGVRVRRNHVDVDLSGHAATGYFIRSDLQTVVIPGEVEDELAYVDIPQSCLTERGPFTLAIKISGSDVTQTVRVLDGSLILTQTDALIAEAEAIPTLDDIFAQIAAMEQATDKAREAADAADAAREGIQGDLAALTEDIGDLSQNGIGHISTVYQQTLVNSSDGTESVNTSYALSDYIKVDRHIALHDNTPLPYKKRICYYDVDKAFVTTSNAWDESREVEIIPSGEYAYVRVNFALPTWEPLDPSIVGDTVDYTFDAYEEIKQQFVISNAVECDWQDGYVDANGNLMTGDDSNFVFTQTPILLKKGETLTLTGRGYLTNVAMIAEYNAAWYGLNVLVKSVDSSLTTYSYTAEENILLVLSANKSDTHIATTSCEVKEKVLSLAGEVSSLTDKVGTLSAITAPDYMLMFHTAGIVGDSLSSGEIVYWDGTANQFVDRYDFSWLSNICRKTGATAAHYSVGGMTAKNWLVSSLRTTMENDDAKNVYYIALGTNDRNQSYPLGTIADASGTDSFAGYMKQIVDVIKGKAPNAVIFMLSLYSNVNDTYTSYSDMIAQIAGLYDGCYFIDYANNAEIKTTDGNTNYVNGAHFTTAGYVVVADTIHRLVNKAVEQNLGSDFIKFFAVNNG